MTTTTLPRTTRKDAEKRLLAAVRRRTHGEVPISPKGVLDYSYPSEPVVSGLLAALSDYAASIQAPVTFLTPPEMLNFAVKNLGSESARPDHYPDGVTTTEYGTTRIQIVARGHENARAEVLIHELAHALLHQTMYSSVFQGPQEREIEAQTVAHFVTSHLGLDHLASSADYIAGWATSGGEDIPTLRAQHRLHDLDAIITDTVRGRDVRAAERKIIAGIEKYSR